VGAMSLTSALRPFPAPGDYVIAADRGYDSLMAYGVVPDLVVVDECSMCSLMLLSQLIGALKPEARLLQKLLFL